MGDRRNKGCLCNIFFFKFGHVLQQDHIPDILTLQSSLPVNVDRDVFYLKIAFLVVCVDFQRILIVIGMYQLADQTAQQIIF